MVRDLIKITRYTVFLSIVVCMGFFMGICVAVTVVVIGIQLDQKTDGAFISDSIIMDNFIYCEIEEACLHEVGHFVDYNYGEPSQSPEFAQAVDDFMDWCRDDGDKLWPTECAEMVNFPGILGNDMADGWGGYKELYAQLYSLDLMNKKYGGRQVAEVFKPFFSPNWSERLSMNEGE